MNVTKVHFHDNIRKSQNRATRKIDEQEKHDVSEYNNMSGNESGESLVAFIWECSISTQMRSMVTNRERYSPDREGRFL